MVLNALAAAAVGKTFGLNKDEIKKGIESFSPTGMRMEISKIPFGIDLADPIRFQFSGAYFRKIQRLSALSASAQNLP